MTSDAALDELAFLVSVRLMGPDARRHLRLALVRSPDFTGQPGFDVPALKRLDALLDGRRPPETCQDQVDLVRAEQQRGKPAFDEAFWLARVSDLSRAGFTMQQAAQIVQSVRSGVAPTATPRERANDEQSQA